MKSIFYITFALAANAAFAQSPPTSLKLGTRDHVQLVGLGQMPLPIPKSELQRVQAGIADDGFSSQSNEPGRVRQFLNNLEIVKGHHATASEAANFSAMIASGKSVPTAPIVVGALSDLKLGFAPAVVRSGKLIGVVPQGTLVNGAWTGVERFYEIEGGGYSRISETDMAASGGMFYMNKAAVNATVAGKPAISVVFTDDQGRRIEEVLWVHGPKLYTVTYAPEMRAGRDGTTKANAAVSAFGLATELR